MAVMDRDLGFNRIVANIRRLDGRTVNAGILRDAGTGKNGVPIVEYATYNEYGTSRIPSRPFVRIASDENRDAWCRTARDGIGRIIDGTGSADECCENVGQRMRDDIRKVIGDKSKLAPNAQSTIRRKGHDKPLIDTGLMKSKVNYRVD